MLIMLLSGCQGMIDYIPTATPTKTSLPPLDSTATINPLPPTPISNDFNASQYTGINNATAASAPGNSDLLPQDTPIAEVRPDLVNLATSSGIALNAELYRPANLATGTPAGARTPGILIISTPFDDWGGFPVLLHDAGFTVLNVQIRIPMLPGDFKAMLDYLAAENTVDPEKMGVIGAESGGDNAFIGCSEDSRCKALVMLTPTDRQSLLNTAVIFNNAPRPLLIANSQDNTEAAQTAQALRLSLTGDDITLQPFDSAGRGTQMLFTHQEMAQQIIDWYRARLNP
ncbi:MAG TPA: hypothetical protein VHL11_14960 [Phototrophicaceae bacterium]|nr:hypothetical protein [Phototrophicaceae bacterium]